MSQLRQKLQHALSQQQQNNVSNSLNDLKSISKTIE
jgi:hypothetical protein